ncbi:phosphoglycerate kinase [Candidatus Bathyarchaeota archaeon]|nr:phosphoglycerate kinase [Candidatus Bathyarchaeota archaeon]
MDYLKKLEEYELTNLSKQLVGPTLVRVDINVPVRQDGRINRERPNLRLKTYGSILDLYSRFSPLVVMAHQGRKGEREFVKLNDHYNVLGTSTRYAIVNFEPFVEEEEYLTGRLARRIKNLKKGEVLLLDNIRYIDYEEKFDNQTCPYIPFFKKAGIKTCVNDGLPLWHRANSSVMALPHIAQTYVGVRSHYELGIQEGLIDDEDNESKAIVIGGKKPKFEAIPKLASKMDLFTGGLTATQVLRMKGKNLGESNNKLLEKLYNKPKENELLAEVVKKFTVETPKDFVIQEGVNVFKDVPLSELPKYPNALIKDVGMATIEYYSEKLQAYEKRIRAGPMGVYEEGFNNGSELVRSIVGPGFVAVGGDTVEELQDNELCDPIIAAGGTVLLGGGAHLDGWAGDPYPSIDELLKVQKHT